MKNIMVLATFLFLSLPVLAEDKTIVVAYDAAYVPVSDFIDVDAEYMALELILSSTADSSSERAELLSGLIKVIRLATTKDLNYKFQVGESAQVPVDSTLVDLALGAKVGEESSYYLFTNLGPEQNIRSATQDVHAFLAQIKVPAKTSIKVGKMGLAMSSPENYRDQLLHNLKKEIEKIKSVLGEESTVSITGLENPVYVRRKDDKKVTLFLDYKIRLGL